MDDKYLVLQKLSELVQDTPQPTQYQCIPRQMILLMPLFDWATIYEHLSSLEEEGLVVLSKADNIQFSITQAGMDKAGSLERQQPKSVRI
ncbi:MAG: hypothetical protein JWQ30_382 [Sediminibacterium sp.]|nr:hypothetical protein [Sediminibacterium sp.]